jgi:hypothetical protein
MNPSGFCECGCGEKTTISKTTSKAEGTIKGYPKRFIRFHWKGHKNGNENSCWKGGRVVQGGYIIVTNKNHPRQRNGYIYEHTMVMEQFLNRQLNDGEYVHHINNNGYDNRIENLLVVTSEEHQLIHFTNKVIRESGTSYKRKCRFCKEYDDPSNMTHCKNEQFKHNNCENEYKRNIRSSSSIKYVEKKKRHCIDCFTLISRKGIRCRPCAQKNRYSNQLTQQKDRRRGL